MKDIRKVLLVCSIYKPNIGGVETAVNDLSQFYRKMGIETVILTKKYPLSTSEHELINGISVWRMKKPRTIFEFMNSIDWLKKHEGLLKSDIVHIIGIRRPLPIFSLLLSRLWDVPFVVTFSGGDLPEPKDLESIDLWKEGKEMVPNAIMHADWLTSFSRYTKKLAQHTIPKLGKVDIIYAGIELSEIIKIKRPGVDYKYFFSARRLEKSKGIDILLKAFKKAKTQLPRVKLLIAGTGLEESNLRELTRNLKLTEDVKFLGNLSHEDMCSYMKSAVAHICPSRAESGGTVNFEAQASGCLAIGSDIGGIPEYIINGKTGYTFPSEDYNTLAGLLILSLTNPAERKRLIENAKNYIKKYDNKNFAKKYLVGYIKTKEGRVRKKFQPWSNLTAAMWKELNSK